MNPNDRLLLVSLNKSFDDAKANGVYRRISVYEKTHRYWAIAKSRASQINYIEGVYHFPVEKAFSAIHKDHQSSGYDVEACKWSNIPDVDFALADDYPWTLGQFVWTGFDYLGEPSPYDTDSWPNHSSMFGIIDLASIPKDRYWLYRSVWNTDSPTLHIVPHWTWPGREGEVTPVYVYTSWPEAELFVNGVSMGRRSKAVPDHPCEGLQEENVEGRYRLMWDNVVYHKGEIRVVAYDADGNPAASESVCTAGKPYALRLECDRETIARDGEDLAYVTVSVVDKEGNPVPTDTREVFATVSGAGEFRAIANGDPCSLELFHLPKMHLFSGKLTVIVRSLAGVEGPARLTVKAKGLKSVTLDL